VISHGTVRYWDDDEGFGVLDSADTPGGCWAHFSAIAMSGFRALVSGDPVAFVFEAGRQDGYSYRAVQVCPAGVAVGTPSPASEEMDGPGAISMTLTVESPEGTVTTYGPDDPAPRS
jgi:CspA family cold shock protein